jgi:hypothetical protein
MPEPAVPLSVLTLDLPEPPAGWAAELDRRGVAVVLDDLGRAAVDRETARVLFAEHRENEAMRARKLAEVEQRMVAADEARRAALPKGVPAGMVPEGMTAGLLMMAADPMQGARRQSVLEHSLANPDGGLIFHPIRDEQTDQ